LLPSTFTNLTIIAVSRDKPDTGGDHREDAETHVDSLIPTISTQLVKVQ
jgi:hypothetical protein